MTDDFEQDEAGDSPDDHADGGSLGDASPPPDEPQGDTTELPDTADAGLSTPDPQYEAAIKDALAEDAARYHVANNLGEDQIYEAISRASARKIDEDLAIETCIRMEGSADNYAAYLSQDEPSDNARVTEQMKFRIQEVKNRILDGS